MIRRPPRSTRTDTLLPYTTLFRSQCLRDGAGENDSLLKMQPLAVSANYLSAPDPGEVELEVIVRKQGRQVALFDVELSQAGRSAVRAAVTLGFPDDGDPTFVTASSIDAMSPDPPERAVAVSGEPPMAQETGRAHG